MQVAFADADTIAFGTTKAEDSSDFIFLSQRIAISSKANFIVLPVVPTFAIISGVTQDERHFLNPLINSGVRL